MQAKLVRISEYLGATLGTLTINEMRQFVTLELPWRENKSNVSCIPKGNYKCVKVMSPHFGRVYEVANVPNRSNILIHIGNTVNETQGCILLGLIRGDFNGRPAVLQSRLAINELLEMTRAIESFDICIV